MAASRGRTSKKDGKPAALALPHVRPVAPLDFSAPAANLREGERHVQLCRALFEMLDAEVDSVVVGKTVYFRANDPGRWVAPDAFVKLGAHSDEPTTWKSWERGAPEVAFEILSPSDSDEPFPLEDTIARYHELGTREVIVFDVDAPTGERLRVWDRLDHDLVERVVEGERTPCLALGFDLAIGPVEVDETTNYPSCLRLVGHDGVLVPTREEEQRGRREAGHAKKKAADASRAEAESLRSNALARGNARATEFEAAAVRRREGR